ncbi:hypothetical protein FGO68_gene17232 [Halteria grandinella]|uniref:Uncharacterized protein n=1 Tax=Halteria grandinella TaxID=5974 RepID=A0A8J8P527_HALGN|nr:hypothetical protein FGO68_gene17232 [Halteria grandinella]
MILIFDLSRRPPVDQGRCRPSIILLRPHLPRRASTGSDRPHTVASLPSSNADSGCCRPRTSDRLLSCLHHYHNHLDPRHHRLDGAYDSFFYRHLHLGRPHRLPRAPALVSDSATCQVCSQFRVSVSYAGSAWCSASWRSVRAADFAPSQDSTALYAYFAALRASA